MSICNKTSTSPVITKAIHVHCCVLLHFSLLVLVKTLVFIVIYPLYSKYNVKHKTERGGRLEDVAKSPYRINTN